jgi:hypothetical protein
VPTSTETADAWPRTCKCGESWAKDEWSELPSDGRYYAGSEGWMEIRMCVCGVRLIMPCEQPA